MVVLNHNEIHYLTNEKTIALSAVASGVHIGSSNWVLNVQGESELSKYGIITNCCLEGQYRYPKQIDTLALSQADCLLLSSGLLIDQGGSKGPGAVAHPVEYSSQILSLVGTIQEHLNASANAKVVLPVQPTFLLELVDLLLHKINEYVSIVVLSESAHSVVEYANINLEYLNQKLQDKIYNTEKPLSFDKLFSSKRLKMFSSIQEYLNSKKAGFGLNQNKIIPNEFQRELFITSHESLRIGEAAYLMQNLNMQMQVLAEKAGAGKLDFVVILTDPFMGGPDGQDGLLLKPFTEGSRIQIIRFPITASVGCTSLPLFTKFLKVIQPRKVVCSEKAHKLLTGNPGLGFPIEPSLVPGNSFEVQPSTEYSSYYTGTCPSQLASEIQLTKVATLPGGSQVSRLPDVRLEMKDNKYHVQRIAKPRMVDRLLALG